MLFDRGGRELPIAPDFVGRVVEVEPGARLEVLLGEDQTPIGARVLTDAAPTGAS